MFSCQYIDKLLNVFNVSMFLNFFNIFNFSKLKFDILGQKGSQKIYFLKKTLIFLLKVEKQKNENLEICFNWTTFYSQKKWKYCQDGKKWKNFNIEVTLKTLKTLNIESNSMLKFLETLTSHWFQCSFFWHWKHWIEINVNVDADPYCYLS